MQAIDSYIEYQRLGDGSRRWLWQVIHKDRLWRAGIEHLFGDARAAAHRAWQELREGLPAAEAEQLLSAEDLERVDLRELDPPPPPPPPAAA